MTDIVGSPIFDSWLEPVPELRSTALANRHLIYEGGGIVLDLLLKDQDESTCLHIAGQVLPEDNASTSVSDLQVLMEQGANRLRTHTKALGEFSFHAVPNGTLDLAIILKDRRFIVRGLSNHDPRMWKVLSSVSMDRRPQ